MSIVPIGLPLDATASILVPTIRYVDSFCVLFLVGFHFEQSVDTILGIVVSAVSTLQCLITQALDHVIQF